MTINQQEMRRAAFEERFKDRVMSFDLHPCDSGNYLNSELDAAWQGFQSACDLMASRPVTDEEVERVARAIFDEEYGITEKWVNQPKSVKQQYKELAQAALNAMKGE